MSGLNVLLWTIAVILILGVVVFIAVCIYAFRKRKQALREWENKPTVWDRLKEVQRQQEELLKKQREK